MIVAALLGLVACIALNLWLFRLGRLLGIIGLNVTKHVAIAYLCQILASTASRDAASPARGPARLTSSAGLLSLPNRLDRVSRSAPEHRWLCRIRSEFGSGIIRAPHARSRRTMPGVDDGSRASAMIPCGRGSPLRATLSIAPSPGSRAEDRGSRMRPVPRRRR